MKEQEANPEKDGKTFSAKHWQPLLDLITPLEQETSFGHVVEGETKEGVMHFPYIVESELIGKFRETVNRLGIMVIFDWGAWKEGYDMLTDVTFDFDSTDIPTKCKLITAAIRADRFNEGFLVYTFASGQMLRILESIRRQVNTD